MSCKFWKRKPRTITKCDEGHEFDAAMQSGLCPHDEVTTDWLPEGYTPCEIRLIDSYGLLVVDAAGKELVVKGYIKDGVVVNAIEFDFANFQREHTTLIGFQVTGNDGTSRVIKMETDQWMGANEDEGKYQLGE